VQLNESSKEFFQENSDENHSLSSNISVYALELNQMSYFGFKFMLGQISPYPFLDKIS